MSDTASQYTFGHEIGHGLHLRHDARTKNLMTGTGTSGLPKVLEMGKKADPPLPDILQDEEQSFFLRQRALITLGEIADVDGFGDVASFLTDTNPVFRIMACRSVVKIDPVRAAELIIPELHDVSAGKVKFQCLLESGQPQVNQALLKLKSETQEAYLLDVIRESIEKLDKRAGR